MREAFERCIRGGGVAVFPADTVYGLACDPQDEGAVRRLYELKGRPAEKPAAVMFFDPELALRAVTPQCQRFLRAHWPGALTALVANPEHRFPLACGPDPDTLGLRVPDQPLLAGAEVAVLQSSANVSGGPDARTLEEVPAEIRAGADLVLDAGELPGTPSTVVDLRAYESTGEYRVLRQGPVRL